jgi:proliferating cell nuclear antigen
MRRRSRCSNHRPATRPFSTHRRWCANSDDAITIKSDDAGSDTVAFLFEAPDGGRVAEFELRLMDITSENLGIPDTEYAATVRMPAVEFQRIVKDLATIGDTVEISVTKDGVKFATTGDIGSATVIVRQVGCGWGLGLGFFLEVI